MAHVKRVMLSVLVHVLASVIRILTLGNALANTSKTVSGVNLGMI